MDKNCGNCYSHCYSDGKVKKVDGTIVRCLQHDQWEPSYNYIKNENAELKSQLARFSRHPFDAEKKETWPNYSGELLVGDGEKNYLCIFFEGRFFDRNGTSHFVKWWSYLPE